MHTYIFILLYSLNGSEQNNTAYAFNRWPEGFQTGLIAYSVYFLASMCVTFNTTPSIVMVRPLVDMKILYAHAGPPVRVKPPF